MNRPVLTALLVALSLLASSVAASVIYRWVDDDGVVHFGSTPPGDVAATVVDAHMGSGGLVSQRPEPPAGEAESGDEGPEISYAEQRRRARAEQRAERRAAAAETARQCAAMRRQRDALEPGPRVIIQDESGNPVRMSDEARLAALQQAHSYLAENCTGD